MSGSRARRKLSRLPNNAFENIEEAVQACTVRVDVGEEPEGTGFFVAPNLVATCAHVVDARGHRSPEARAALTVVDWRDGRYAVESISAKNDDLDLALLRVDADRKHPCVLLDGEIGSGDNVFTFGYTQRYPQGLPTTLFVEGVMGGNGWQKLKGGQVQPGMSGSALMNWRTFAVCGLLKRSRSPGTSLGGYAIPGQTIARLDATVSAANERFHEADSRWLDLLEPRRQRRFRKRSKAQPAPAPAPLQFTVTVSQVDGDWQVEADVELEEGGGSESIGPLPVDLNTVRREVTRLFRDWAARGRVKHREQQELLGRILFRAVFPGEIGDRFEARLVERNHQRLSIALHFVDGADDDLMYLPWEHASVPDRKPEVLLATDKSVSFTRTQLRKPVKAGAPLPRRSLSVLVVAVKPREYEDADRGTLARTVDDIVKKLDQKQEDDERPLDVDCVETPDGDRLAEVVEKGYDIVHYVGFGRFDDGSDEIALGANTQDGTLYFPISTLAACLSGNPPSLVVLQPCAVPREQTVAADFAVFAPALLNEQTQAVVAYQSPTLPDGWKFNETLYTELSGGGSVEQAVQRARGRLLRSKQPSAYVPPALFKRHPGEFALVSSQPAVPSRQDRSAYGAYA